MKIATCPEQKITALVLFGLSLAECKEIEEMLFQSLKKVERPHTQRHWSPECISHVVKLVPHLFFWISECLETHPPLC